MALDLCPNGHPSRSSALNNLAASLLARSGRCGWNEDIDDVIELLHTAVEADPAHHPDRSLTLNNLATALRTRCDLHGQAEDVENAVKLHHAALQLCPKGHHDRSLLLNNLATSLEDRFNLNGRMEDICQATELLYTALELRPEGHSDRSSTPFNLANCLYVRFRKCRCAADFQECIRLLELATTHSFSGLRIRLLAGRLWTELARRHDHKSTITAYSTATTLLQNALTVSPTLHTQHETLAGNSDFASLALEAASYAMRGLRSPLDQLAGINKELSDRFRDVGQRLENLATSSTTLSSGLTEVDNELLLPNIQIRQQSFDEMLLLKRQLAKEQGEIINEIRRLPGFENFLAATPFNVLQRAASEGPVIVVNQCRYRSDALIVLPRADLPIVGVPLDKHFYIDGVKMYCELLKTRQQFTASSSEYEVKLVEAMKMLWDRVVFKVVNKLEELGINEGSRIWWCLTDVLSALPFHAAGPFEDKDGTSKYLLDKYISSYTPTLGALINARSSGNGGEPKVLIIGDTSLPSAKGEIRRIRNCGISTKVLRAKASRDVIIEALRKTTWVHFVCHGSLDSKPLNSSFKVSDRGLTLLDIVQGNISNAEFAFLSACHTAEQPPGGTQDEVLHLAAAMQFSGFRSVIGLMWELLDADGPFFANAIYEYMWDCDEGEVRYNRAAAGLRQAAVDLKARGGVQTERWVNLVHIAV
ncbi:uncharacterized protein FOMMEDRAFT_156338 [Fomitiporia mediterranea MF3/22]|uniref:uncharacterized protein n=1 Tax=Fomitiporia mediterranea (strain MF3/22) TaxID=694068 RepID=UPI00044089C4|nr:uncharacterized protein FOMMEDRAFT_156338 [Fomitiporia mediterranea MF3/22]EJD02974.1 hypothetical protein FOMMEDRAFT_156338 [Fomitiporia mediterranea MF3/22]